MVLSRKNGTINNFHLADLPQQKCNRTNNKQYINEKVKRKQERDVIDVVLMKEAAVH